MTNLVTVIFRWYLFVQRHNVQVHETFSCLCNVLTAKEKTVASDDEFREYSNNM